MVYVENLKNLKRSPTPNLRTLISLTYSIIPNSKFDCIARHTEAVLNIVRCRPILFPDASPPVPPLRNFIG